MRKIIGLISFLIIMGIFSFFECSTKNSPAAPEDVPILGYWNWVKSVGSYGGVVLVPGDSTKQIEFRGSGYVYRYINEVPVSSCRYSIKWGYSIISRDSTYILTYGDDPQIPLSIDIIDNDSLVLVEQCYDCFTHRYVKVR